MKQRELSRLVKKVDELYEKTHQENLVRLDRIENRIFGIMKCTVNDCKETTRRGMNNLLCWKNGLCPVHAAQAGIYKKNYDTNAMPFRKRTRPY